MTVKDYIIGGLLILLLISGIGNILQYQSGRDSSVSLSLKHKLSLDSAHSVTLQTISEKNAIQARERILRKADSLESVAQNKANRAKETAFLTKIQVLTRERAAEGVVLDPKTIEIEAGFMDQRARDSTEIVTLQASKTLAAASFTREIAAVTETNLALLNENAKQLTVIDEQAGTISKLEKTAKWYKRGIAAAIVVIVFQAVKDDL